MVTYKYVDFEGFYFENEDEGDTRCLPSGVVVFVDMMMLQNRSGVERLGAPLAETMQRERWSSKRGRLQSSLRFGVDEVEDGRSAQACCTFLLARRGWKDVCRKQSKCCRTSPAATEVAVQCRDSAQQQNRSLERLFQDAMRPMFRLCCRCLGTSLCVSWRC